MKATFQFFKDAISEWSEDKASRLAAALAYYTIFSIAPLLVLVIALAGFFFGRQAVQGQIEGQLRGLVGDAGATLIQGMIASASQPRAGLVATVIGLVTLFFGASGVFGQLQDSLNTIWEVMPRPGRSIWAVARDRLLTFGMVLGIGFLLLVSLVVSAGLSALSGALNRFVPGAAGVPVIWQLVNQLVSFAVVTLLFAMLFKYLPDVRIRWRDVWVGAAITSLLFTIGKFLIGLYLGRSSVTSAYGAAGSLVVVLLWIYYSAQILFLGAEFTQVYARRYGQRIEPARDAVAMTDEVRAQQGIPRRRSGAQTQPGKTGAEQAPATTGSRPARAGLLAAGAFSARQGGDRAQANRFKSLAATGAGLLLFAAVAAPRIFRRSG